MSDPTPVPPQSAPASAPTLAPAAPPAEPADHHRHARPRRRTNPLAVIAFILALLLSPLAALFGHIAAGQIHRSAGAERGAPLAWTAVALGYLWLAGAILGGALLYQAFTTPFPS
jgi:hypothetical protein